MIGERKTSVFQPKFSILLFEGTQVGARPARRNAGCGHSGRFEVAEDFQRRIEFQPVKFLMAGDRFEPAAEPRIQFRRIRIAETAAGQFGDLPQIGRSEGRKSEPAARPQRLPPLAIAAVNLPKSKDLFFEDAC